MADKHEELVTRIQKQLYWNSVSDFQKNDLLTDVTIECGGNIFRSHKLILGAGSPYFKSMFSNSMQEPSSGTVCLKDCDADSVTIILDVLYGRPFNLPRSSQKLKNLLKVSHKFQMVSLYDLCCKRFVDQLSHDYFVEVWNASELYGNTEVLNLIPQKLADDFHVIRLTTDFLELSVPQLIAVFTLVDGKGDEIVDSILRWVKHDLEGRQNCLIELFSSVNFEDVSGQYMSRLLKHEDLVKKSSEILAMILAVATSRMDTMSIPSTPRVFSPTPLYSPPSPLFSPVQQMSPTAEFSVRNPMLAFIGIKNGANALQYFDVTCKQWSVVINLPFKNVNRSAAVVAIRNNFYFISSKVNDHFRDTVSKRISQYTYPESSVQEKRCSLAVGRNYPGAVLVNGKIYVLGGETDLGFKLNNFEVYDPESDICENLKPAQRKHSKPEIVAVGKNIYVFERELLDMVEHYDIRRDQWTLTSGVLDSLQSPFEPIDFSPETEQCKLIAQCGAAVSGGKIYVIGKCQKRIIQFCPKMLSFNESVEVILDNPSDRIIGIWGSEHLTSLLLLASNKRLYEYDPEKRKCEVLPGTLNLHELANGILTDQSYL